MTIKTSARRGNQARAKMMPDVRSRAFLILKKFPVWSAGFYLLLSCAMFGSLLFNGKGYVWSFPGNDMTTQNVPWLTFAFSEISHGNFPLWNPHNFCGTPFFSNFNPGVLYPPHWLCLILPIATALNCVLFINVTLAGWFTALWCNKRGVSSIASLVAGTVYMYSGPYFYHQFPGHEAPLASMAWTPLVFLAIDGIFEDLHWKWSLLGMFAVAMQILAGFPQAVYYTGLMGGLYSLLRLVKHPHRREVLPRLAAVYAGAVLLAAVQLLPGVQTAGESSRQGGNSYEFAASCPLPPENLLQLLAPSPLGGAPLGDGRTSDYVGTWYPWEISVFFGITTLVLAAYGATRGKPEQRQFASTLLIVALVLALGVNLKWVFSFCYYCIPLFSSFRTTARFNWFMSLYLAMLAGIGFDALVALRGSWRPVTVTLLTAFFIALLGAAVHVSAARGLESIWGRFVHGNMTSKDFVNMGGAVEVTDALATKSGENAAHQFWFSALTLVVMSAVLALLRLSPRLNLLLAAVTVGELFLFANGILAYGPPEQPIPTEWRNATARDTRQYRELHPFMQYSNLAMIDHYNEIFGYDPVTLKRYCEFAAIAQDISLDDPRFKNFMPPISNLVRHPDLFRLLRCKYFFGFRSLAGLHGEQEILPAVQQVDNPMPQLQLIQGYIVASDENEIVAGLQSSLFNPREAVILESTPDPAPQQNPSPIAPGTVSVAAYSTDWMEIQADLPESAILLVTDSYSKYWRAVPIEPGPQTTYNVLPADLTLRAIPLAAGKHHFLLEYAPSGFRIGKWISIVSLLAWLGLALRYWGSRGQFEKKPGPRSALVSAAPAN